MSVNVQIRPATEGDLVTILEITNHEIINSTVLYEYEPKTLEQQTAWFNEKLKHNWPIIMAEVNGVAVGFGTFGLFRARPAYSKSIEHSVYVHKDHRGKAIGNVLMVELIKIAIDAGWRPGPQSCKRRPRVICSAKPRVNEVPASLNVTNPIVDRLGVTRAQG